MKRPVKRDLYILQMGIKNCQKTRLYSLVTLVDLVDLVTLVTLVDLVDLVTIWSHLVTHSHVTGNVTCQQVTLPVT
jgi:hypothetical protein